MVWLSDTKLISKSIFFFVARTIAQRQKSNYNNYASCTIIIDSGAPRAREARALT